MRPCRHYARGVWQCVAVWGACTYAGGVASSVTENGCRLSAVKR